MSEPSLLELQRWMQQQIRYTSGGVPREYRLQGRRYSEERLRHRPPPVLSPQRGTPGVERLAVYAGGYVARTREALAQMYEAVRHVVGDRAFAELARRYAIHHSSHDYNLNLRGRHLPEFLATDPLTDPLPFLPDLARLERLISQAFHAREAASLDSAQLRGLSLEAWSATRLVFQPSVGVVASAWPIVDIWEARTRPREEVDIDLVNRPQRGLVFRQGLTVRCELVDEFQQRLLDGLLAGRPLGVMCDELAQASDGGLPVDQWCASWARRGLIVRLHC
mgnify:CR=1 FL=1